MRRLIKTDNTRVSEEFKSLDEFTDWFYTLHQLKFVLNPSEQVKCDECATYETASNQLSYYSKHLHV